MNKLGNPYKEMATTCMTRPMAEKKVVCKRFESEPFEEGRFQAKVLSRRCISSAATLPNYRLKKIMQAFRAVTWKAALASGAEYFTTFLETWHDITQKWCIKDGWRVGGIFPGNFVRWKKPDQEYRGCTLHCYRFVRNGEDHATLPEEWSLAPKFRELWEVLERINKKIGQKGDVPPWLKKFDPWFLKDF